MEEEDRLLKPPLLEPGGGEVKASALPRAALGKTVQSVLPDFPERPDQSQVD